MNRRSFFSLLAALPMAMAVKPTEASFHWSTRPSTSSCEMTDLIYENIAVNSFTYSDPKQGTTTYYFKDGTVLRDVYPGSELFTDGHFYYYQCFDSKSFKKCASD